MGEVVCPCIHVEVVYIAYGLSGVPLHIGICHLYCICASDIPLQTDVYATL